MKKNAPDNPWISKEFYFEQVAKKKFTLNFASDIAFLRTPASSLFQLIKVVDKTAKIFEKKSPNNPKISKDFFFK